MKLYDGLNRQWSTFDAQGKVKSISEEVQGSTIARSTDEAKFNSVVGIRAQKIPFIKGAINNYIAVIEGDLKELDTNTSVNIAFQGTEITEKVKAFVVNVKEDSQKLIRYLRAFNDKLSDVEKAYNDASATLISNIDTASNTYSGRQEYQPEFEEAKPTYDPGNGGMPSGIPR